MNYKKIEDGENILEHIFSGEDLIPINLKIEVYYNSSGTDSGSSDGYSKYYVIDKKISRNELIKAVENGTDLRVCNDEIEILKNEDCVEYFPITSILSNVDDTDDNKKKLRTNSEEYLLRQLQELQADFEDFSDEELIEHRDCMLERINQCLEELGECDEDNLI